MQLAQQHPRVGRPLAPVAGGGAGDERVDVRRDARHQRGRRGHVRVHVLVGDLDRRLALVRLGAGEQLVEHDPDGVHVGTGVGPAVDHQLGREVGDGADQHPAGRGVLRVGADRLGQPEVGHLHRGGARVRVGGDQHVLGLDVAVDQAGAVRRGQRGEHRLDQGERPRRSHRALLADQVAQGVPAHQLHGQEDGAVVGALVEDRHDVRVGEPGRGAGLAHEAGGELVVVAEPGMHHLDRDGAVQAQVGGLVDAGHAAARDPGADPVAPVQQSPGQRVAGARVPARAGVPF